MDGVLNCCGEVGFASPVDTVPAHLKSEIISLQIIHQL
jgi:hypothetical protein